MLNNNSFLELFYFPKFRIFCNGSLHFFSVKLAIRISPPVWLSIILTYSAPIGAVLLRSVFQITVILKQLVLETDIPFPILYQIGKVLWWFGFLTILFLQRHVGLFTDV